jgi:hypothetical protein
LVHKQVFQLQSQNHRECCNQMRWEHSQEKEFEHFA